MPKMNGRDLYEKIAALHPETRVILMSGYAPRSSDHDEEDVPFLQKPFSVKQLSAKVREVLDGIDRRTDEPMEPG
jgi:two-component system cell cycle sensor histidine kinase/response regulator CckA